MENAIFLVFFQCFYHFFNQGSSFLLPVVHFFPKMENCNFPRVFHFFKSVFIFFPFFYHVSSFLLPVVQKFSPKSKIAIFLVCFMFLTFFIIFFICLSFFIICASSGANIFKKMENCNFLEFFSFVYLFFSFFIIFQHFCFQWCKKIPKNGKLQFSAGFYHVFYFSFFFHVSSFLLSVVQKFCKTWKIAIFLDFFFIIFSLFFMFHHFCFQWCKIFSKKMENCNFLRVLFFFLISFLFF